MSLPSCANQRPFISLRIGHKWFSLASKIHSASGSFFGNPYQRKSLTPCRLESVLQCLKVRGIFFNIFLLLPLENSLILSFCLATRLLHVQDIVPPFTFSQLIFQISLCYNLLFFPIDIQEKIRILTTHKFILTEHSVQFYILSHKSAIMCAEKS